MHTGDGDLVSENAEYMEWLLGFVTGFNSAHVEDEQQQVTRTEPAGVDLWMRNWCNKHPTQKVVEGIMAFIRSDAARR
jgi:hypothetical protein